MKVRFEPTGQKGSSVHETHSMMPNPYVSYLAKQTPGVFTDVGADGGQQQSLSLYELEDEVSVHAFNGQLSILIFCSLHTCINNLKRSSASLVTR